MIRTIIQRLTTDVGALRAELEDMRGRLASSQNAVAYNDRRVDEVYEEVYDLRAENDRLRALAGNTEATPGEAIMLGIVSESPGLLADEYGRMFAKVDPHYPTEYATVYMVKNNAKHLTSLHKKGLVRRERAGQSYRYWPVGGVE